MGTYCKAFETARLAEFPGWPRGLGAAPGEGGVGKGHLFLHEDFTVTGDIFQGEDVVFDAVTPEWVEFCREILKFEVPSAEE